MRLVSGVVDAERIIRWNGKDSRDPDGSGGCRGGKCVAGVRIRSAADASGTYYRAVHSRDAGYFDRNASDFYARRSGGRGYAAGRNVSYRYATAGRCLSAGDGGAHGDNCNYHADPAGQY